MSADTRASEARAYYAKQEAEASEELQFEMTRCAEQLSASAGAMAKGNMLGLGGASIRLSMRGVEDAMRKLDIARAAREASDITAGDES